MPRPSSVTAMMTSEPSCIACRRIVPCGGLPAASRSAGVDAVIDGVADQVKQRVGELMQHAAVHFGVGAASLPADVLALRPRQVAHGACSWSVTVATGTIRVRVARSCRSFNDVTAR